MKGLKEFQIDIISLAFKLHEYEFSIDNRLFELYEHSLVKKGSGNCKLFLEKSETMLTLNFEIEATVELICDRSLDKFDHPISVKETLIMKFGEENYSLSEDVLVIRDDTATISVDEYIYEFISLAVPLKKLHPRFEGTEEEQPDLIYTSVSNEESDQETLDPRWEALKKLKGNN
ncbi:MAG: DUF177 domain-containing protein [Cyclobacteriaceae bacterium]